MTVCFDWRKTKASQFTEEPGHIGRITCTEAIDGLFSDHLDFVAEAIEGVVICSQVWISVVMEIIDHVRFDKSIYLIVLAKITDANCD